MTKNIHQNLTLNPPGTPNQIKASHDPNPKEPKQKEEEEQKIKITCKGRASMSALREKTGAEPEPMEATTPVRATGHE